MRKELTLWIYTNKEQHRLIEVYKEIENLKSII